MKKLLLSRLMLSALLLPLAAMGAFPGALSNAQAAPKAPGKASAKAAVKWHPTLESALAEAKRTGKPIFVDVFTTWCGPCKFLDAVTYKDPAFVSESKKWILVKVDAEKNPANVQFATKFKVNAYPTMIFMTPEGKESGRAVGGYPAKMLVPVMKKAGLKAGGGKSI